MNINEKFGRWMRKHRKERGWSQIDMEVEAGSSAKYICDVELGLRNVSLLYAKKVCDVFGKTLVQMFDEIEDYGNQD